MKSKFSGKFIVLDGLDGCGKTTQVKLLADYLKKQGVEVVKTHDPGGTAIGDKIRKLVKYGVWENDKFIGCVIFGRGASKPIYKSLGFGYTELVELVQVVLNVHLTPVTKIISICIKALKKSNLGLKIIVSFSDMNKGHYGSIYQAGNWVYTGETARAKVLIVKGKIIHKRTLGQTHFDSSKMKKTANDLHKKRIEKLQERGTLVLTKPKHRYLYPLNKETRKQIEHLRKPYPKRPVGETASRPAIQPETGGSTPTTGLVKSRSVKSGKAKSKNQKGKGKESG